MVKQNGYTDTDYLQIAGDLLRRVKEGSYALMGVGPGQKVLDMGCGPGTDTLALAHVVGAHGQVVGVDFDAAMVVEADQRAERAGVSAWVSTNRPTQRRCRSRTIASMPVAASASSSICTTPKRLWRK